MEQVRQRVKGALRRGERGVVIIYPDGNGGYTYPGAPGMFDTLENCVASISPGTLIIYDDLRQ